MTSESLPNKFYRLVYFSPRPEDGERVCVAVIVWDEGKIYYLYDKNARKARGLSREYGIEVIGFMLQRLEEKATEVALKGSVPEFSPQIQVSKPRVLLQSMDDELRNLLIRTYLSPQKRFRSPAKQAGVSRRIEEFLSEFHVPKGSIIRRASAEQLFGKDALRHLPDELIPGPVARAVNLSNGLLLLDGVDVHASTTALVVEHVGRVVHTYWQCKKAQELLNNNAGKLTSAAVVFNGDKGVQDETFLWRIKYATEQFKEADLTIDPTASNAQDDKLRTLLSKARPHLTHA